LEQLVSELKGTPDEGDQVKQVYAVAGLALFKAQCFEKELQNALIAVRMGKGEFSELAGLDSFSDELDRKTLGKLLAVLGEHVEVDQDGTELLQSAVRSRNQLAHHFFKVHAARFNTGAGRLTMMYELLQAIRLFGVADRFVALLTGLLRELFGITEVQIEQERMRLLAEAEGRP
jgi:hypothetical protein